MGMFITRQSLPWLWQRGNDALRPQGFRQSTYALLLSTLAINVLSLALPVMTLQIYDRILPNMGSGTLPVLITGVLVAVMLEAVLRLCRSYVLGRSAAAYEHRMACAAMDKILHADISRMGSYGIGEHLHRMGAVSKLKDFYNGYALTVMAELCFVPLFLMLIFYISGAVVLVPAVILGVFIAVSLWRGHRLKHALTEREKRDDTRFNFLIESLEGIHTLKAFALENFFTRRYEALEDDSTRANYAVTQETAATFNSSAIFSHIMVAAVISVGAWSVLHGMLTTGGLIATMLLSGRIMQPVQKGLVLWARYQDYHLARVHIEDVFATPQHAKTPTDAQQHGAAEGDLKLENISFTFANETHPVLRNINLELRRGEVILLSGEHGSGKTTLLNIIAGIYPTTKGSVILDGLPISHYPSEILPKHVGYIGARPVIFRGTIRDNITGFGQVPEVQARKIAAILNVDKQVAKLPGGFDTFLNGSSADSITPGLKQHIAMVRVLATRPRLILFDNADRALDKDGYATIYSLLARVKHKATMVIVSEDRNLRSLADRHYVLKNGMFHEAPPEHRRGNIRPFQELRL